MNLRQLLLELNTLAVRHPELLDRRVRIVSEGEPSDVANCIVDSETGDGPQDEDRVFIVDAR